MKFLFTCTAMLAMVLLAWNADGAEQAKKAVPVKRAPAKGKRKSTPIASSKSGKKSPAKAPATTWRNRQVSPSPDRYREIQAALANKGYLRPEDATGAWNATSADALKKFQTEQNIDASGKINSLSLIALGLGPRHDTVAPPSPPANH